MENKAPYTSLLQKLILAHIEWNNVMHGRCDVFVNTEGTEDPVLHQHSSTDNKIVLNLGGNATNRLVFLDNGISAGLSFGGRQTQVFFRYDQIIGIRDFRGNLHPICTQLVLHPLGVMQINLCPNQVVETEQSKGDDNPKTKSKPANKPSLKVVK